MHLSTSFAALLVSAGSLASTQANDATNNGHPGPAAFETTLAPSQQCCNPGCEWCDGTPCPKKGDCMRIYVSGSSVIFSVIFPCSTMNVLIGCYCSSPTVAPSP